MNCPYWLVVSLLSLEYLVKTKGGTSNEEQNSWSTANRRKREDELNNGYFVYIKLGVLSTIYRGASQKNKDKIYNNQ